MGRSKCFGKVQARIVPGCRPLILPRHGIQVFQDRKFPVEGLNELPQYCDRLSEADAADTIAVPQCKDYSLFVFWGDVVI